MSKGQFWNFVKLQMLGAETFLCGDVCFLTQMEPPKKLAGLLLRINAYRCK